MQTKQFFNRVGGGIFIALLLCLIVLSIFAVLLNGPVGSGHTVKGKLTQPCVSPSKLKMSYRCVAEMGDGSTLTYSSDTNNSTAEEVTFVKRNRRFVGYHFQPN